MKNLPKLIFTWKLIRSGMLPDRYVLSSDDGVVMRTIFSTNGTWKSDKGIEFVTLEKAFYAVEVSIKNHYFDSDCFIVEFINNHVEQIP
jgi:hypothetical protein